MREASAELSLSRAVRLCGRRAAVFGGRSGEVVLEARGDSLAFSGLLRCNSVWQCPVCAPRIMQERAEGLRELWERHQGAGGSVLMITLTAPHDYGQELRPLRRHVSATWRKVVSGAPWLRWKAKNRVLGFVRSLEVTNGRNGWHPHLHVLVYFTGQAPAPAEVEAWFFERWSAVFTRGTSWRFPSRAHGVTVSRPKAGDYLAKMGLSAELALSHTKEGRKHNRTPWQILRDYTAGRPGSSSRERDKRLWLEWADAMTGARQLTVSRELRRRYPAADQIALELEPDGAPQEPEAWEVARWTAAEWEEICSRDVRGAWRVAALSLWRYARADWRRLLLRWECELLGRPYPPANGPPSDTQSDTAKELELELPLYSAA